MVRNHSSQEITALKKSQALISSWSEIGALIISYLPTYKHRKYDAPAYNPSSVLSSIEEPLVCVP
jgi:hypothetical protein